MDCGPRPMLADMAWPAAGRAAAAGALLLLPIGSTEQHGPHLPLSTDSDLAAAVCAGAAARRAGVVVAPTLPFGSSGEHQGFAGTLSIGQQALRLVVTELVRSAQLTFPRLVVVNGHGGNAEALRVAAATLRGEGRDVHLHALRWAGDAHAGEAETSLQLALDPHRVGNFRTVTGQHRPVRELTGQLRAGLLRDLSPSGVLGDPRGATADTGQRLLSQLVEDLLGALRRRWPDG